MKFELRKNSALNERMRRQAVSRKRHKTHVQSGLEHLTVVTPDDIAIVPMDYEALDREIMARQMKRIHHRHAMDAAVVRREAMIERAVREKYSDLIDSKGTAA